MGSDELDEEYRTLVIDGDNQAVFVSSYVKDNSLRIDDAGIAINLLHVRRIPPLGCSGDLIPCTKRLGRVGLSSRVGEQRRKSNNSHLEKIVLHGEILQWVILACVSLVIFMLLLFVECSCAIRGI